MICETSKVKAVAPASGNHVAGRWSGRLLMLVIGAALMGCGSKGTFGGGASSDPEVQRVVDLNRAGTMYQNYIDAHRKGPPDWQTFYKFATENGMERAAMDRLQSDGYQFLWNVDLRSGLSMTETVLAESSSHNPKLMLDGSLSGVSPELLEKARAAANSKRTSRQPVVQRPDYPKPTTPLETKVFEYLQLCEQYVEALQSVKNAGQVGHFSGMTRVLDSQFDRVGVEMAQNGMQVDFLATPAKYKDAVRDVHARIDQETNRIANLPNGDKAQEYLEAEIKRRGMLGPDRARAEMQRVFNQRQSGGAGASQPTGGTAGGRPNGPPPPPHSPGPGGAGLSGGPPATGNDSAPSRLERPSEPASGPEPAAPERRTWADRTGKFRVEAELVSVADGKVRLRRTDQQEIEVPIDQLSDEDQQFLATLKPPADAARPNSTTLYQVGESVEVESGSAWYAATILRIDGDRYYIKYDDYSETWNEWLEANRIRKQSAADGR